MTNARMPHPAQWLKHIAVVAVVLTWAFVGGFAAELWHMDSLPAVTFVFAGVVGITTMAITAFGRVPQWMVVEGIAVCASASVLIVLGDFFPYATGLGARDPGGYGGEAGLLTDLPAIMTVYGVFGAAVGLVVGALAWILSLARNQPARDL